jgi:ubiquinol-cytochrome c reductase cytochrome b subunit
VPFWPYFVIKDLFALAVILVVFFAIVGFMPNYLGHPDNYIEANPLVTPRTSCRNGTSCRSTRSCGPSPTMSGSWRSSSFLTAGIIDAKFFGVLAMFGRDRGHGAGALARHLVGPVGPLPPDVQVVVLALRARLLRPDVAGAMPAEGIYPYIALIGTAYWFAYFLVILPL